MKFSADDFKKIEAAVAAAEKRTSGEIVPMIVSRSSVRSHVPFLAGLVLALLILSIDWYLGLPLRPYAWLAPVQAAVVFGLAWLSAGSNFLLRLLTDDDDLAFQCQVRARLEFWEAGLHKTDGSTGVLIFISNAEHQAVVLADDSVAKKLPEDAWQPVVDRLVAGLKKGDCAQGFSDAIDLCASILEKHFPPKPQDRNELPNRLVVKD
ncbi:MAG TPA: TPM domain-containing protein [Bdellovibrionales bacterium]|nr:TPM domain-containing protein [Bdellovibrionales bacterium]